jgi:hypothetical protein
MTTSSSISSPSTSRKERGPGSSTCQLVQSITGSTSKRPSSGTSKALQAPWKLLGPQEVHLEKWGSLRDYIRRFSQKSNELLDAIDADVISAFTNGTTNEALIHELGQGRPRTTADLIDIATIIDVEDAIGAIFHKGKSPHNVGELSGDKRERWENLGKRRRNHHPQRGKEEVATMDRPPRPLAKNDGDQFQKLMNSPCQNHDFPVLHKLQEYELLTCFISKPPCQES